MRHIAILTALIAIVITAGCGGHRCETYSSEVPIYVNDCPSFTYLKEGVDEPSLLADEKRMRALDGVANIRTTLDGGVATVVVTVHRGDDIAAREEMIGLGYHRRW